MQSLAELKELLKDERVWSVAARVDVIPPDSEHYEVNEEGDIIVSCYTLMHGVPLRANIGCIGGPMSSAGVWAIPPLGTEVLVAFDHGDFEGEAYLVGYHTSGSAPTRIDGSPLVPGVVLVVGSNVEIKATSKVTVVAPVVEIADAEGNGQELALKSDVAAVANAHNGHTHLPGTYTNGGGSVTGESGTPSSSASAPTGTQHLKGN